MLVPPLSLPPMTGVRPLISDLPINKSLTSVTEVGNWLWPSWGVRGRLDHNLDKKVTIGVKWMGRRLLLLQKKRGHAGVDRNQEVVGDRWVVHPTPPHHFPRVVARCQEEGGAVSDLSTDSANPQELVGASGVLDSLCLNAHYIANLRSFMLFGANGIEFSGAVRCSLQPSSKKFSPLPMKRWK